MEIVTTMGFRCPWAHHKRSAQEEAGVAVGEEAVVAGEGVVIDATPFAEEG